MRIGLQTLGEIDCVLPLVDLDVKSLEASNNWFIDVYCSSRQEPHYIREMHLARISRTCVAVIVILL